MSSFNTQPVFEKDFSLRSRTWWITPALTGGLLLAISVINPFLLIAIPFAVGLSFVPGWILGGRLLVHARPGHVRLIRRRWRWKIVRELSFPPGEVPHLLATRPYGHKPHGVLRVTASTGQLEVPLALHEALVPVASDLTEYFNRRG